MSLVHKPAAWEIHAGRWPALRSLAGGNLILRPTEDGWSVMTPDGELVFRGFGTGSRRQCLDAARARGATVLLSSY